MRDTGTTADAAKQRQMLIVLRDQLNAERKLNRSLQEELRAEVEFARKAGEETLAARGDREDVRRVLAAAVANEKSAVTRTDELLQQVEKLQADLQGTREEQGVAKGRAAELDKQLSAHLQTSERLITDTQRSAREESKAHATALEMLAVEKGALEGQAFEMKQRMPWDDTPLARFHRVRAYSFFASAGVAFALALMSLPAMFLALLGDESAQATSALTGLSVWQLVGLVAFSIGLGLGLGSLGLRDLRLAAGRGRKDEADGVEPAWRLASAGPAAEPDASH